MIFVLLFFILSYVLGLTKYNVIKGPSCMKTNDNLYALGGETYVNGWHPVPNIYKAGLDLLNDLNSNSKIPWTQFSIKGYRPQGSFLTATAAPLKDAIYCYGGRFKNINEVAITKIYTRKQIIESSKPGPDNLLRDIKSFNNKTDITIKASLIINDLDLNELVLLGVNLIETDNKVTMNNYVHFFDTYTMSWTSFPSNFITGSEYISFIFKGNIFAFGPDTNPEELSDYNQTSSKEKNTGMIIGTYEINSSQWKHQSSSGDVPPSDIKYSYTQERHMLYLVGYNQGSTGKIFALHLETFKWTVISEPGFIGYGSGCLTFQDNGLIHYFGTDNTRGTQFIDISSWPLEARPSLSKTRTREVDANTKTYLIIIGTMAGLFISIAAGVTAYFLRRKRQKLKPPELLEGFVPCDNLDPFDNRTQLQDTIASLPNDDPTLFEISELDEKDCFGKELSHPDRVLDLSTKFSENSNSN